MTAHGNIVPCGDWFEDKHDADSHVYHCDQCAGVLESLEGELTLRELAGVE